MHTLQIIFSASIIFIAIAWLVLKLSPYLVSYFEKEHIRNDLEPKEYVPSNWSSAYLDSQIQAAKILNLIFCGSYFTAKAKSMVKGPMMLYRTECGRASVALVSAKIFGAELKKIEIRTRFTDGTALITSDQGLLPDTTEVVVKSILYKSDLKTLLDAHVAKLESNAEKVIMVSNENAFQQLELIEIERAQRLVSKGYAVWCDAGQSVIRRTWRGAIRTVQMNKASANAVIQAEVAKMKQQQAPK